MKRKYYQITTAERVADINIYGDITSWKWLPSDVTSFDIKKEIDALDVDAINVYINSYGGEVAEALAIYSTLKRHSAKVHTYCDGFACSAATIIFVAGDERTMSSIGLMMIHNCMSYLGYANSAEMRKAAEDNDKINQSSIEAYKAVAKCNEDEIKDMMDKETWLTAEECLEYGFATEIAEAAEDDEGSQQSVKMSIRKAILNGTADPRTSQDKMDDILNILEDIKEAVTVDPEEPEEPEEPDMPEEPEEPEEPDMPEEPEEPEETYEQKAANFFACLFN